MLPVGGSVGAGLGPLAWQKCWMGKEVLVGSVYENTNFKNTSWPGGNYGTLLAYMGGDVQTAKKMYRCEALPEGVLGSGEGSNGYFDYAMVMAYSGATLGYVSGSATLRHTANPSTWEKKRTPLIVEEDPYWWINSGANMEPGHGNRDKIGVWHYGHGNYASVDGSVSECRPLVAGSLNPDLNNWYVTGPSGGQISLGAYPAFNSWKDR